MLYGTSAADQDCVQGAWDRSLRAGRPYTAHRTLLPAATSLVLSLLLVQVQICESWLDSRVVDATSEQHPKPPQRAGPGPAALLGNLEHRKQLPAGRLAGICVGRSGRSEASPNRGAYFVQASASIASIVAAYAQNVEQFIQAMCSKHLRLVTDPWARRICMAVGRLQL